MNTDFCDQYDMLPKQGIVLCAVSGGKDSMYLMEKLRELSPAYGYTVYCAHFNHRLRGEESDRDERFVRDFCEKNAVPCRCGSGNVAAFAEENGMGIEEAARVLRYEFLETTADEVGALRIATAHTADDNLETLLFNLARGTGLKGLCGIPPVRGRIIRPLLQVGAEEILRELKQKGIAYVEDSTNAINDCSRNKIRHGVVPLLREINPGFDSNAVRCQSTLREDSEYLDGLAATFIKNNFHERSVSASKFAALPAPISARVLQMLAPRGLSAAHIALIRKIASCGDGHAVADIPDMRVIRDYDSLIFDAEESVDILTRELIIGGVTQIPEAGLEIVCQFIKNCMDVHNSFNTFYFKNDNIYDKLFIKSRSEGDKIRLNGRKCTKTLKKLFSEEKLNGLNRGRIPVLYDAEGPVAVYRFGVAERCGALPGDDVIRVEFRPLDFVGFDR